MKYLFTFLIAGLFSQMVFATCPSDKDIHISNGAIIPPPGYEFLTPPSNTIGNQDTIYFVYALLLTSPDVNSSQEVLINDAHCYYSAVSLKNTGNPFSLKKSNVPFKTNITRQWTFSVDPNNEGVFSCDGSEATDCPFQE